MYVQHSAGIWDDYPHLVPGVIFASGITRDARVADVDEHVAAFSSIAAARLADATESELPEIQAWRRTFARMGLKPTQYRCASESLLRRFRKESALPRIHPLIDLCNAVSMAFAIPVAVFDVSGVAEYLEIRHATGDETYLSFSGAEEHPDPREVIFADAAGRAHARRWTNRQSAASAVRETTDTVLIAAEAMHASAAEDVPRLIEQLADALTANWSISARTAVLSQSSPRFDF